MITRSFCTLSLIFVFATTLVANETTIFVSFSNFGEPNVNTNNVAEFAVGDFASAYLWIETDVDIDTLSVANVVLSNAAVVSLTNAEVFNPDILLNTDDSDVGDRWDSVSIGPVAPTGDSISGLTGFSSGIDVGTGIRTSQEGPGGTQRDTLFDSNPNASAFLFARFDFEVVGNGSVQVAPSGIFLNEGQLSNFGVGNATIIVVPEPVAGCCFLSGLAIVLIRRRRK